jgi:hypothetical protein
MNGQLQRRASVDVIIVPRRGLRAEQVRKGQALTEENNPILAIEPDRTYAALD